MDSLERQREEATSEDALRDAAFKYGYQSEGGEQVYYFVDEENGSISHENKKILTFESGGTLGGFTGIPTIYLALASLVMATLITLCYAWMLKRRRHMYELEK